MLPSPGQVNHVYMCINSIYWECPCCGSLGEKATERTPKAAQVAVSCRFERPALFIGCQHQRCSHHCLGQRTGAALSSENAPYRLLRVQFVASRLSIFTTLPRTIDRSNAKRHGKGVNPLFLGLLAVFRVENLSTQ